MTVVVLAGISQRCLAEDTLVIHVRDLEGTPLTNAFVKVYKQEKLKIIDGKLVTAEIQPFGSLRTSNKVDVGVLLGDSLVQGSVVQNPPATFTLKVDAVDPQNRSFVIVAGRRPRWIRRLGADLDGRCSVRGRCVQERQGGSRASG